MKLVNEIYVLTCVTVIRYHHLCWQSHPPDCFNMSLTTSRRTSSDATGRSMSEIRALYSIAGLPQTPIDVDAIGGDEVSPSTQE